MNNDSMPFLSIVIPAYNEGERILKTLAIMIAFLKKKNYSFEIIVIDDGSIDNTGQYVKNANLERIRLITIKTNKGKGNAVKTGMMEAKGKYILMADADNATPFEELERLLEYSAEFPIVIGSRYLKDSRIHLKQPFYRIIGSRIFNLLVQVLLLPGFPDTQCGFKLFQSDAAQQIFSRLETFRWGFDLEVLVRAKKLKYKIKQVPVDWYDQPNSKISLFVFFSSILELLKIKMRV